MCYHMYNNESVFGIVTYTHDTQPPYLYNMWKLITALSSLSHSYPVGLPLGLFTNRTFIILALQFQEGTEPQAYFLIKRVSKSYLPQKQANTLILYTL